MHPGLSWFGAANTRDGANKATTVPNQTPAVANRPLGELQHFQQIPKTIPDRLALPGPRPPRQSHGTSQKKPHVTENDVRRKFPSNEGNCKVDDWEVRYNQRSRRFRPAVDHSALPPNDLLMACTCGDASAWEEFIRRFSPVIARVVFRVACRYGDSSKPVIDDLVQDTYLKLCSNDCKLLKSFEPEHAESIFAFLKVVASCVAKDYFKSKHAQKRGLGNAPETLDEVQASAPGDSGNSPGSLARIERGVLIRQIDEHLSSLLPSVEAKRGRTVFWLYYRAGFSASAIASLPTVGLTTKGVESLLLRITRNVRRRLADSTRSEKGLHKADSF